MNQLSIPSNIHWSTSTEFYKEILDELKGKNVLLFLSTLNAQILSLEKWIALLKEKCSLTWIENISPNPTYEEVYKSISIIRGKLPEVVLALGGGSTIDMAKSCVAMSYLSEIACLSKKDVLNSIIKKDYLNHSIGIPIYSVPTTAGTGSEVTRWATVWDMDEKAKYSIEAPNLYPKRAYIVPEFTLTMPKRLTLSTGLDALCQAVEAYWAKSTNSMVKELSKASIRLIIEFLPKVLAQGDNLYYREKMCLGSLYSGMAFSNTRTTACHSISYPLTMQFGVEHGLACALTLAEVMKINFPVVEESEELLEALNATNTEDLQVWLDDVSKDIVRLRLSSFGIESKHIPDLVKLSFTQGRMDNNPIALGQDEVKEMLMTLI